MKTIDDLKLRAAIKAGKTTSRPEAKPAPVDVDIDDRDPMDRVADELVHFAATMQTLSCEQAKEITALLKLMIETIEKIGQARPAPVNVQVADAKPREWNIAVTRRDKDGLIEGIKLTAAGKPTHLN